MARYTIIGGDLRNIELANELKKDGNHVSIYGFSNIKELESMEDSIKKSDVLITPIVFSKDDYNINAPFSDEDIKIKDFLDSVNNSQIIILGNVSDKVYKNMKHLKCVNILEREEMTVLNAIPTAEGAIQAAMESLPITIHGSNCMVLGFGRIGKVLAKMLRGIGANVYVEARKDWDLSWIYAYGYNKVCLKDLGQNVFNMDIIFNTIPSIVIDHDILVNLKKEVLIIDLASKPHGVDFDEAKKLGINAKLLLALPGKVAPKTSAIFMKDAIYNIVKEMEVL